MTDITDRHAATVEAIGLANGEAPKAPDQQQPPATTPDAHAQANAEAPNGEEHEDESATSDDSGTDAAGKPRRNRLQERIDQITREKYEATARAEAAEARAAQFERHQQQAAAPNKPTLESCGYDQDAYESALVVWAQKQGEQSYQQRLQQERIQQRQQEQAAKVTERIQKLEEKTPGAWEATISAPINYSPPMVEAMRESEIGPELGYYLSQHLDEAHSITRLSPVAQVVALGRLEAKLLATAAAPPAPPAPRAMPRTVTNAPPPPPALQAASKVATPLEEQSIEDRIKAIREHEARR